LTLACLNLKKLVKRMARRPFYFVQMRWFKRQNSHFSLKTVKKTNTKTMFVCNLNPTKSSFQFALFYSCSACDDFNRFFHCDVVFKHFW
ncbi:hypothetical protein P7J10_05855, partial [Streptococcus suis]